MSLIKLELLNRSTARSRRKQEQEEDKKSARIVVREGKEAERKR